jgi:hypothetical protein
MGAWLRQIAVLFFFLPDEETLRETEKLLGGV